MVHVGPVFDLICGGSGRGCGTERGLGLSQARIQLVVQVLVM